MAEYLNRAAALAQSAAEISKRVSEGIVENAKDFGFESPDQFYDNAELRLGDIKEKLDSRSSRDKLEGMRRLLAVVAKGHDASQFFPDVVKNVASSHLELRQLVYMYLLTYAEQEQDLALLSINTFQKDLSDPNQGIRAMALRVLSGVRVPLISSIVLMAIQKGVADRSPYVRKTAAYAIPKLHSLDPDMRPSLVGVIKVLLNDNTPLTIGSVIQAFNEVCPDRFDLIHEHFTKLCQMVLDADEWGQIAIVNLLMRYARTQFLDPHPGDTAALVPVNPLPSSSTFTSPRLGDETNSTAGPSSSHLPGTTLAPLELDHELLLQAFAPLLQSDNSAVVMAVVAAYYHIAPQAALAKVVKPLIRLLRTSPELEYTILTHIAVMCQHHPHLFAAHQRQFFVRLPDDPPYVWELKIEILQRTMAAPYVKVLLRELERYLRSGNAALVHAAIRTLALCVIRLPQVCRDNGVRGLVVLAQHPDPAIVGQALDMLREIVRVGLANAWVDRFLHFAMGILARSDVTALARANVYWLVGQYAARVALIVPDVLRLAAKAYRDEPGTVQLQIITLAAKVLLTLGSAQDQDQALVSLCHYLFALARYDLDYDLRDRARMLFQLVQHRLDASAASPQETPKAPSKEEFLANAIIFPEPTSQPSLRLISHVSTHFTLCSLSLFVGRSLAGYRPLAPWPTVRPRPVSRGTRVLVTASESPRTTASSRQPHSQASTHIVASRQLPMSQPRTSHHLDDLDAFYDESSDKADDVTQAAASLLGSGISRTTSNGPMSSDDYDSESSDFSLSYATSNDSGAEETSITNSASFTDSDSASALSTDAAQSHHSLM
ncbi:AP-3 complex subunit beta [Dimargaris verticillata]|uniref:AP-3 complex subunit beta n=1 Tax=Dimargaris verticillata TaxID=2761393 RepID=A0A9W8EAH5_9FUNG|nr:AP-3 complex subunit beta [Dimargaris verticillata]